VRASIFVWDHGRKARKIAKFYSEGDHNAFAYENNDIFLAKLGKSSASKKEFTIKNNNNSRDSENGTL
jgi:hypothetical protein